MDLELVPIALFVSLLLSPCGALNPGVVPRQVLSQNAPFESVVRSLNLQLFSLICLF